MHVVWSLLAGLGIAFAESGLGIGMFLPGETAIVVLTATMPTWELMLLLAGLVAVGACAGDHVGYLLGRRYGDRLRTLRPVQRLGVEHFDRAMDLMRRRGAVAVFGTRLLPVLRTVTPAAAGASGLSYRSFVLASFAGSCTWAGVYVGGGSVVAVAADAADGLLGRAVWIGLVVAVLVVTPMLVVRVVGGVRRVVAAPDVVSAERAIDAPRARRSSFSPLIGEIQL
ncbi:DedA family protein [Aeromicrobium sp. Leaf350]|uniref:DedA family protein n=1 Tax=Aeromicrobium sp. Leaf350 TaxID=2876565 RepID=UPI001E502DCA|nr:DedA family protein [Aeromicrobium sp. Leaf350]